MKKIDAISFYKGVAIILIVMIHTSQCFALVEPISSITKFGDLGCQIFFTISAFCLCLSYENRRESYIVYFKRRLKRIAPGYWLTIILSVSLAFISILITGKNILGVSLKPLDIGANIVLINGLTPQEANNHVVRGGWFVGTLVILYALFPLFYKIYKRNKRMKTISFLTFLMCLLILVFDFSFWKIIDSLHIQSVSFHKSFFFYFSFINQMSSFVLGFYMYILYETYLYLKRPRTIYYILFPVIMGVLVFFKYGNYEYRDVFTPFFVSLSFVYLFEITRRLFDKKWGCIDALISIGKNSYSIYLLNTFIAWEVGAAVHKFFCCYNQTLVYIVWLPVAVGLLYVLSIYYEKLTSLLSKLVFN